MSGRRPTSAMLMVDGTETLPMKCGICGRQLDQPGDPLSIDCGGDCWGCIGEIEADMGDAESTKRVREEFARGLRPDWIDPVTSS